MMVGLIILEAGLCCLTGLFCIIFISVGFMSQKIDTEPCKRTVIISILISLLFYIIPLYLAYSEIIDKNLTIISFFIPVFLLVMWIFKDSIGSLNDGD